MELKDMILSTLAELEEGEESIKEEKKMHPKEDMQVLNEEAREKTEEIKEVKKEAPKPLLRQESVKEEVKEEIQQDNLEEEETYNSFEDERHFCESMRERILVLFEGFQSPNNKSIEAKVDLTLNFLEYLLAVIDERLEILNKQAK